jgi:hypothetical protein
MFFKGLLGKKKQQKVKPALYGNPALKKLRMEVTGHLCWELCTIFTTFL